MSAIAQPKTIKFNLGDVFELQGGHFQIVELRPKDKIMVVKCINAMEASAGGIEIVPAAAQ